MSKAMRLSALMLAWIIVATGTAPAPAEDPKTSSSEKSPGDKGQTDAKSSGPEKVLTDKELTKNDRKFLLDEAAAIEKYGKAKTAYADFQKAYNRSALIVQYDENVLSVEMQRQELQQEVALLQTQINGSGGGYGRMRQMANMQNAPLRQQMSLDQASINQMNAQLQAFKSQAPKADDRKTAPAEFSRTRDAYVDAVHELNEVVAPLLAKYHELALDKEVIDALAQLRHSTTLNFKLGPSDEIAAASKMIQNVKKNTAGPGSTKTATKKKAKAKGS